MALRSALPLRLMTKNFVKQQQYSSRRLFDIIAPVGAKVFKGWGGRTRDEVKDMFEEWMIEHNKVYKSLAEKEKRFEIFRNTLKIVENHNSTGSPVYKLGLNMMSDLTLEEAKRNYCGIIPRHRRGGPSPLIGSAVPLSLV
ncbi:hypothetical protein SSX86_017717 [Deinandra increscens subsp. villosa]|uniref:Cathepsin propeptide inhibitor domain-containing protein n=1 Tax=Deinandra increscens subsp. villosa TaxID=3103831 RepID=A0AAP0D0F1_9ASTR